MAVETNLGHAFEIDLNQSINTETVDFDIQQISGPAKPVANNGFVRAGSLTNLYKKADSGGGAPEYATFVASTGDVCQIKSGAFLVNGVSKGNTNYTGAKRLGQVPAALDFWIPYQDPKYCLVAVPNGIQKSDLTGATATHKIDSTSFVNTGYSFGRSSTLTTSNYVATGYRLEYGVNIVENATGAVVKTLAPTFTIDNKTAQLYVEGDFFAVVYTRISDFVSAGIVQGVAYGQISTGGLSYCSGRYVYERWDDPNLNGPGVVLTLTWDFNSGDTSGVFYNRLQIESTGITLTPVNLAAGTLRERRSSFGMSQSTTGSGVGSYTKKWLRAYYPSGTDVFTLSSAKDVNFSENSTVVSIGNGADFNIGIYTVGGVASHLSMAPYQNVDMPSGVLITPVGDLDKYATPQYSWPTDGSSPTNMYGIAYLDNIGNVQIIKKVAYIIEMSEPIPGVVKINNCTTNNLFSLSDDRFYQGHSSYNGAFIQSDVTGASQSLVALKTESKYTNSIDAGGTLTYHQAGVPSTGIYPLWAEQFLYKAIYVAGNYDISKASPTDFFNDQNLTGTLYVENSNLPIPVTAIVKNDTAIYGNKTFFLNHNTLTYPIGNELPQAYTIFRLQGSTYGFDGSDIWLIPFNTGTVQTPVWIAPATGLTFICESPQAAFFLAEFDNSIYGFDGGRMVQRVINLNRKPAIQNAVYNVEESALHLVTASSYIIIRDGIVTEHTRPFVSGTVNLYPSKNGVAREQAGAWSTLVLKSDTFAGETVEPLTWQSAVFGPEDSQTVKFSQFVFRIYNPAGVAPLTLTSTYKWITVDETGTETKTVSLVATDFDSNGYTVFRVGPAQDYALGASIGLSCDSAVVLLSAVCYYSNGGPSMPTKAV